MAEKNDTQVNICWLKKRHQGKCVCFIPLTIDGTGDTPGKALKNLEVEASRIIKALRKSGVKCNFTEKVLHQAVEDASWWNETEKAKKRENAKVS